MKVSSLEDVITIKMSREEAAALTAALYNEIDRILTDYKKFGESGAWKDLAIMGQVRDCLHRRLRTLS